MRLLNHGVGTGPVKLERGGCGPPLKDDLRLLIEPATVKIDIRNRFGTPEP